MKGLFIKDIRLFLQRKNYIILVLMLSVVFIFTMDGTFGVGYMTVLAAIFSIGTLSYDDHDNCYSFLMTLPVDRKSYVSEKYLYSIFTCSISWILAAVLYICRLYFKENMMVFHIDLLLELFLCCLMGVFFIDVMIPMQLKFGAEKSRMVLGLIGGVVFLTGFMATKITKNVPIPKFLEENLEFINQIDGMVFFFFFLIMVLLLTMFSRWMSYKIFDKKEF